MKIKYLIIGSGVGGLAAAAELKSKGIEDFLIVDKCESLPLNLSNGVHYLHSIDFGTPFEFEFQEIRAKEQIWHPVGNVWKNEADIPEINEYGMKAFEIRHPSSIQDPGSRAWKTYIPLSNNMNDLLVAYKNYIGEEKFLFKNSLLHIDLNSKIAYFSDQDVDYDNLITTSPLNCFGEICSVDLKKEFKNRPVFITNYKTTGIIPNWLICLYIPDKDFPPYRITVMNNIISMESSRKLTIEDEHNIKYHLGKHYDYELETKWEYCWETGRIWGLSKKDREEVVNLFKDKNIHLLGRYGCWSGKLEMANTIEQAKKIIQEIT